MINELWSDHQQHSKEEVIGAIIRSELNKETTRRLDMSYLAQHIDQWWQNKSVTSSTNTLKLELQKIILENLKREHLEMILGVGNSEYRIAALLLESTFNTDDKTLAQNVHEVISKIAGIVDIKYPYEEHKELYPKTDGDEAQDWGKGLGIIRPHSDDIYENRDVNIMSLTVCRDTSSTPTWFWLVKDIINCLSDQELGEIALAEATFYSGTNVEGTSISQVKPVLRRHEIEGLSLRLDFRIDDNVGPRMRFTDSKITNIFEKMRTHLRTLRPIASTPVTGSIGILSNFKILHGRNKLNPVMLYEGENSRILFRSKGIKEVYHV